MKVKEFASQLNEGRAYTVPRTRSALDEKSVANYKDRYNRVAKAHEYLAKALNEVSKAPRMDFMGDLAVLYNEIDQILNGEGAGTGTGLDNLVRLYKADVDKAKKSGSK